MITKELAFAIGAVVLIAFVVLAIVKKLKISKIVFGSALIIYLTAVASITLFPIIYDGVTFVVQNEWYNFIPFKSITDILQFSSLETSILQIAGNICLAIPYGFSVMLLCKKVKWWKLLLFAVMFSVGIELTQLIIGLSIGTMYRAIDIDDVILNTIGAFIGYGLYAIIPRKFTDIFHR